MTNVFASDEAGGGLTPRPAPLPGAPGAPPTSLEVWGAAFGYHSTVANAIDFISKPVFPVEPDYNPQSLIAGTKFESLYGDRFTGDRSEAETRWRMARIEEEEKQRATLAAGGWEGIFAGMAAGILDPTTLIPIGGWIGVAGKTGRVLVRAGEGAAVTGLTVAGQEAALQTTQESRPLVESVFAIAGATILGGALGGSIALLTRGQVSDLTGRLINIPGTRAEEADLFNRGMAGVGAASTAEARGSGVAAGSLGVGRATSFQGPMPRLINSPNPEARNVIRDLAENPNQLAENADGIATSVGGSVESQAKVWNGVLAEDVVRPRRRLYSQYVYGKQTFAAPLRGSFNARFRNSGKLSYGEFKEAISEAALNGDRHAIPEVAEAARMRRAALVDKLRDEAIAARVPGFADEVAAGSADESYLTRIWNTAVVRARRNDLVDILARHFEARQAEILDEIAELQRRTGVEDIGGNSRPANDLTPDEIKADASDVVDAILGHSPQRVLLPSDVAAGPRGPLKERMLKSLPTMLVRDFVERDVDVIDRIYTRTMATDIALMRKFGSVDLKDQIAKINDAANRAGEGKSAAEVNRIQRQKEADIRDVVAVVARLRGTYAIPTDTEGLIHRAARVVRDLNYMRMLGGMTLSAVPDLGRPVMVHGMTRTLRTAFTPFTAGLGVLKLARKEARLAGAGTDLILDDRMMSTLDRSEDFGRGSALERGLSTATQGFGIVSLMAPWNAVMRQFVGIITQTRMLQAIEALNAGKIGTKERAYLAAGGVDNNMADRIGRQFADHGEKHGDVWWANTGAWTDQEAVRAFRSFMIRDVDRTILVPGQEKPLWMSTELGKVVGQFKSFSMASTQRVFVSGLEQRDMAALNGAILSVALGVLSAKLKMEVGGYDTSNWTPTKWAIEGFDRSGMAGWFMDANNLLEKTALRPITAAGLTGETASRYQSRNVFGAVFGPTADLVGDVLPLGMTGEWSAADTHVARKLVPLQNIFWMRAGFDAIERGVNQAFGIPARRPSQ